MMMKNEGKFAAKVIDHDLEMDNNGNLKSVHVRFSVIDVDGSEKEITSFMSLKGPQPGKTTSALEITLKNLVLLGFKGTKDADILALARGIPGSEELKPLALDGEKVVELVLENEEYQGKKRLRVKYINEPGRGGMKRMEGSAAVVNLGGLNIAGHLAAARAEAGVPAVAAKKTPF